MSAQHEEKLERVKIAAYQCGVQFGEEQAQTRIEALERENARRKQENRLLREACRVVRSAMSTYTTYAEGGEGWPNEFEALFRQALEEPTT